MMRDILSKPIPINSKLTTECKQFLMCILDKDPKRRIGGFNKNNMDKADDADDIRAHPFFASINWEDVKARRHAAPFIPKVKNTTDTSAIDKMFTNEPLEETYVDESKMKSELTDK